MRKAGETSSPPLVIEDEAPFVPARGWAEMIRNVYEVDPLLCPSCGRQMTIVSFIEYHRISHKIIAYLELAFDAECPIPPRDAQQELLMAAEEIGQYL